MAIEQLEEGQIVLCTVDKIIGTTVFVRIEDNRGATLTTSEIAPGRIRNLRDYVVPGKKIVCKILSIKNDRIHLSLRRVKQNEKKELLEKIAKETSYKAIIKTAVGKENSERIIQSINEKQTISDFFEKAKKNSDILEEYFSKEDSSKLLKILESKKEKPKEIKNIIRLSNKSPNGIVIIKNIIRDFCDSSKCKINYLAAGKYSLSLTGENFKELKTELNQILDSIERQAKKNNCEFSIEGRN